jgi:hypothetical protein
MVSKNQLQAAFVIGEVNSDADGGYRSGRSSCRDIPVRASTARTRSAGTRLVAIHREMLPCELKPKPRASALWPPMALHALSIADTALESWGSDLDMNIFNADFVRSVNAYSGNGLPQTRGMPREPELEPSAFWRRLVEAWDEQGLPTSQLGIAKKLGFIGNGTTGRWYRAETLPQADELITLAKHGKVTVDWLLTGNEPKRPISPDSDLGRLLRIWSDLKPENRPHVLEAAEGKQALQDKRPPGKKTENQEGPRNR